MKKIILDCDSGQDDAVALALAMAAKDEIEILGVTTVAGNVPLNLTQRNARIMCEMCHRPDVKVYAGAEKPMTHELVTAEHVHGKSGLDGIDIYASGRQDIAQSMGIPGQPEHPKVLEFEEQIAQSVRAAGKKTFKDAYVLARSTDLFLDSARAFMRKNSCS